MAGNPQHATLAAGIVTPLVFDQDFQRVEILNVDGAAAVYFKVGQSDPAVAATGSQVLPAAIGSVEVDVTTSGPTEVRLISSGTPKVSVRGVVDLTR